MSEDRAYLRRQIERLLDRGTLTRGEYSLVTAAVTRLDAGHPLTVEQDEAIAQLIERELP